MQASMLPALGILTIATSVTATPCPLAQSIYRDTTSQGFELVFGLPIPGSTYDASATLTHPKQGTLYQFQVNQTSGYGSISLLDPRAMTHNARWVPFFPVNFFDRDLKPANPQFLGPDSAAPPYLFVTNLGSHDYYQRRSQISDSSPPLLGDPMWRYDRCRTALIP